MARVTVEDCVVRIPNRFELVMLAAQRARDISSGAPITLPRDNDKNPVISLREIAEETITRDQLKEDMIRGLQRHSEVDESDEDIEAIGDAFDGTTVAANESSGDESDADTVRPDALAGPDGEDASAEDAMYADDPDAVAEESDSELD